MLRTFCIFIAVSSILILGAASETPVCKTYSGTVASTNVRSAYATGPYQPRTQPYFYQAWVWREGPDSSQNHSVSVARSKDLKSWENTCGAKINLPITLLTGEIVDSIGVEGGLLNNLQIGGDSQGRPIISYIKYAFINGKKTTQLFNARLLSSGWKISRMTSWSTAWEFGGTGSLPGDQNLVSFTRVSILPNGKLAQTVWRSNGDTTGIPATGTYEVLEDGTSGLKFSTSTISLGPPDSFYEEKNFPSTVARMQRTQNLNFSTNFEVKSLRSRSWDRWIPMRGDFDSDGINDASLYDSDFSKFLFISSKTRTKNTVKFGPNPGFFEPLVGNWNNTPGDGIGFYDPKESKSFLKYSFSSGNADRVVDKFPQVSMGLKDGPRYWHKKKPEHLYQMVWDALPQNRDLPYDCSGNLLSSRTGVDSTVSCPEKFARDLILWEFNAQTEAWEQIPIDRIWGGSSVGLDLLTFKNYQFAAYYNKDRYLTVASRKVTEKTWKKKVLSTRFEGWDSHNYITMIVDENHDLHVVGNQHVNPLNYFRSKGLDVNTLESYPMTDVSEDRVTYPEFFRDASGSLIFSYRNGSSGSGDTYLNIYNPQSKSWQKNISSPLFGQGP